MKSFSLRILPLAVIAALIGMAPTASASESLTDAPDGRTAELPFAAEGKWILIWDEDREEWVLTWIAAES